MMSLPLRVSVGVENLVIMVMFFTEGTYQRRNLTRVGNVTPEAQKLFNKLKKEFSKKKAG